MPVWICYMFNSSPSPRLCLRMIFFPLSCPVCIFSHEGRVVADLVMSTEPIIILSCLWLMFWRWDAGLMLAKHRLYRLSHPHLHPLGSALASASLAHWVLALEKSLVGLVAFPVEALNRCFVLFVFSCFKDSPLALTSASGCVCTERCVHSCGEFVIILLCSRDTYRSMAY